MMKGPPTEADLLQLGKAQSLDQIIALDLSRRSLASIDVDLFNKLTSLETLDISQNCLSCLPNDLRLPKLRVFDCSDNQLDSIHFVKHFKRLQQLYVEDNGDLTLEDYYISCALCPSLRGIDGWSDVKHIQKGVSLYTDELTPAIEAVWEASYSEVYENGVPDEELQSLHMDMVDKINIGRLVGANLTMPKFKSFMIEHLCGKLLDDVNNGKLRRGRHSTQPDKSTPSRHKTRVAAGVTPEKDYSKGVPMNKDDLKHTDKNSTSKSTPVRKRKREDSPTDSPGRLPATKRMKEKHETPIFTLLKPTADMNVTSLPEIDDYDPVTFMRCHSKGNNPSDGESKVWRCAFEPLIGGKQGETSNILASCGGKIVCLIDCQTGKVMKRYKDNSKSESFYTLAWTTMKCDDKETNILAVAGDDKLIKLIHPTQLVMFGALSGHKGYISSLVFHPTQPNILFSASRDSRIIMWKIGTPNFTDNSIKWSQQAVLSLSQTDAITLVVQPDLGLLVAGCETSCFAWNIDKILKQVNSRKSDCSSIKSADYEFVHPVENTDEDGEAVNTVDGLALLPNNCIVSKCVGHGRLYVWGLKEHTPAAKSKLQRVAITPLVQLDYRPVELDYIYPSTCTGIVSVGDDKGNILMYDLTRLLKQKASNDQLLQPSRVLEFPDLTLEKEYEDKMDDLTDDEETAVVNCVAMSSSREYVVSGTDNNLICVWRKETIER